MPSEASLANLKPYRAGESGNPGGRPRKRPQSEASDDLLRSTIPEVLRTSMNKGMGNDVLKKGATWADAIAYGLARKAIAGDAAAAKELADRVEGKPTQRIELTRTEDCTPEFVVVYATQIPGARTIDVKPEKELPPGAPADDETP